MIRINILILLFAFSILFPAVIPETANIILPGKKEGHTKEMNRTEGNFILDILTDPDPPTENDSVIFVATGTGFSMGYNTGDIEKLKWFNSVPGYGGSSSITIDKFNNIWMTTATDSFVEDVDAFLAVGTGVHFSPDSGRTWNHFPQPGITPVQGLTYDIAADSSGGIWMACFGQSIQKSDDRGESWRTLTCGQTGWNPLADMNQRMFSVHITDNNDLWVGTAEGINLCRDYSVPDSLREWEQFTFSHGLTGNFVTGIGSYINTEEGKEYVFAASWLAQSNQEINGVSYTSDRGNSWQTCLEGEKIYSFGFHDNDIYACGDNGLWKSSDNGSYWENFRISAWSENKKGFVDVGNIYSFEYQNGKMFAGSGRGLAVSEDDGNSWVLIEAYEPSSDSDRGTYAYPIPFSPQKFGEIKIQFSIAEPSKVTCTIYNFAMEKVINIASSEYFGSGEHYLTWNGKDQDGDTVANGVYFYIIRSENEEMWNKILIFE